MFKWFTRPIYTNVVKFPAPVPYFAPPAREADPDSIYTIGATSKNTHMTFKLGHSTLTMTKTGCQHLIDQLEVFKNQLQDDE